MVQRRGVRAVALGVAGAVTWLTIPAFGAAKKPQPPELEPPPPGAGDEAFVAESDEPDVFGSGYPSWGTRGGATLGAGDGVRGQLLFGYHAHLLSGGVGLEGFYILGMSRDLDVGIGGRFPFFPFGLAPGANVRFRFFERDAFQLAFDGSAFLAFDLAGVPGGNVIISLHLEPGVMGSFFIMDSVEIFFGALLPLSFMGAPAAANSFAFGMGIPHFRVGGAFTLKTMNLGFFAQIDLRPQLLSAGATFVLFTGTGTLGVQWRMD